MDVERRIAEEKANIARKKSAKASRPKQKKASSSRKQSVTKASPGLNGNVHSRKPRKSKELGYDDEPDSEEEAATMTLTQKQELAEKIQVAENVVLSKAIQIIQQTTALGSVSPFYPLHRIYRPHADTCDRVTRRSSLTLTLYPRVPSTNYTISSVAEDASPVGRRAQTRWYR